MRTRVPPCNATEKTAPLRAFAPKRRGCLLQNSFERATAPTADVFNRATSEGFPCATARRNRAEMTQCHFLKRLLKQHRQTSRPNPPTARESQTRHCRTFIELSPARHQAQSWSSSTHNLCQYSGHADSNRVRRTCARVRNESSKTYPTERLRIDRQPH